MILIIDNLQHKTTKLWMYFDKPVSLKNNQEYTGNDVLRSIYDFLEDNNIKESEIRFVGVIFGKGSFAGIRTAVNIANVYAFYNKSIIFNLKQNENNSKLIGIKINNIKKSKSELICPVYSSSPRITK
ncbi:hypothetical protein ACFL14_03090 [Patescibacteria group bacterium]